MIDILEGLGVALAGTVALCLIVVIVFATVKVVQDKKDSVELSDNYDLVELQALTRARVREEIASEFDRMASQLNPDDRERSALYSKWATNAADRIRHPERYSGTAQGGSDVLHAVSADGTRFPLVGPGSSSSD